MGFDSMSIGSILLILLIVMLLFGTRKLRRVGEDLGNAVRGFREAMHEGEVRRVEPTALSEPILPRETGASGRASAAQESRKEVGIG